MGFAAQLPKQNVEKTALVILRPRYYLEDWNDKGGGVYSTTFSYGRVVRMWEEYGAGYLTRKTTLSGLAADEFYHDTLNGILYVGAASPPANRTAEYELYLSQKYFKGPCDPLDASSDVVEWTPALQVEPQPKNGSRDTQFGFAPLFTSSIEVINSNGWLNEQMKRGSFLNALAKVYLLVNSELEDGASRGDVFQTMIGYCADSLSGLRVVSIPVSDFFRVLDRVVVPNYRFRTADFPGFPIQPDACVDGNEWYVRKVRGKVDGFKPVNIEYSASASTSNNRTFITQEDETTLDEATYTYVVDHLQANTDTKTWFTEAHKLNLGDTFAQTNNGVTRYGTITAINRAAKWIEHTALTGRTVIAGDTCTRYYIGGIAIVDSDGVRFSLMPCRDFQRFYGNLNGLGDVKGFILTDNWEATLGFTDNGGVFDPARHQITCRVYGPKEPEKYSDNTTDVGEATDDGGADATAVGITS